MMTKKYRRNLDRILKLDDNGVYCWARLESVASAHDGTKRLDAEDAEALKEGARSYERCKREGKEIGSCYCGKFRNAD